MSVESIGPQQLTLGFALRDDATLDNFFPGDNPALLVALHTFIEAPVDPYCFLHGPEQVGKTHLLTAVSHALTALNKSSILISLADHAQLSPLMLEGFEDLDCVVIDDLEIIAGNREWEEGLFHLYNRLLASNTQLIIASRLPPSDIPIQLPDLQSRLSQGVVYAVQPLTDQHKLHALKTRAEERGIVLPGNVAEFLIRRCGREMLTLMAMLDTLDKAQLVAKRPLTIPFVKHTLGF